MEIIKWTGGPAPGIWAVHMIQDIEEVAPAIRASIPSDSGYIDGIVLSFKAPARVPMEALSAIIDSTVMPYRLLESRLDILIIVAGQLV